MENKIERDLYISIPLMFLLGVIFHFVFEWFSQLAFIAPFFPVNESIWEHTKLAFLPLIMFYLIYYYAYRNKYFINKESWFTSLLVSVIVSITTMIVFYYTYSGIIGKDYTLVNIFSLLLSLFVGQISAKYFYKKKTSIPLVCSLSSLMILFAFYIWMTFDPFEIALFFDFNENKYSY
ncbi:MAG: hypothetical protein E7184_00785 [Erysipelotrichaceae bacterium]|nr:hypothetical protein [Erysipelotrichaceae bacterium]